ncbi:hypothetical protein Fleli_0353 [Bernardetia litoralis DSM 6794]|uniref:Lipoprotein n=1 Tax=Bernardetia litoralis (strain ATCC 23117 / DSM 6794 / NBRC 15988 / NCIMB 1366 / Fx l1 / Sio-4) TaxID=880071 RepID=I4AFU9_BERLS|nr:hypothetical protein [Bernardetia litoralis]AFM02834.1 hypothetical protein Fleli_0353 [Bernardetia litoralis DSM 6794]
MRNINLMFILIFILLSCNKIEVNKQSIYRIGTTRKASSNSKDIDYNIHYNHYLVVRGNYSYFEVARKYVDTCTFKIPITAIYFMDEKITNLQDSDIFWYTSFEYKKAKVSKKWVNDSSFNLIEFYLENEVRVIENEGGKITDYYRKKI